MTGYVQLGQQIDKNIKRFTQKLKRQPLEKLCSGAVRQNNNPIESATTPIVDLPEGLTKRQRQQQQRGGQQGRRRATTTNLPDREHLLAYW